MNGIAGEILTTLERGSTSGTSRYSISKMLDCDFLSKLKTCLAVPSLDNPGLYNAFACVSPSWDFNANTTLRDIKR
eukprot:jgi/Botrbrau1/21726/Bobra.43_1s0120.1